MQKILCVDDEPALRELYLAALSNRGFDCAVAGDLAAARAAIAQGDISAVITDMRLPDGMGLDLLRWAGKTAPQLPVAVITAYGNSENTVECLKAGAFDYLSKPVDISRLRQLVAQMLAKAADNAPTANATPAKALAAMPAAPPNFKRLIGDSLAMQTLRQQISQFAQTQAPVVITGESGTGKELAARALHAASHRAAQPFVAVNCGAIPENLMEAEFFGVRKGAFTGALQDRIGFFQAAQGGTLMLDEVADLPLAMQVKLLRVLQERSVRRIGDTKEDGVDVRIIAATHKPLEALVASGAFRQDLFYRLNVLRLEMPPLRARAGDIAQLAAHFLAPSNLQLSPEAAQYLSSQAWAGNVRELENSLQRAAAMAQARASAEICFVDCAPTVLGEIKLAASSADARALSFPLDLAAHLAQEEARVIRAALAQAKGNRNAAGELLGLSQRQLRYRIEQLGINEA